MVAPTNGSVFYTPLDLSLIARASDPDGTVTNADRDLLQWTPICTNQVVNGSINFVDPEAQSNQVRFFRAVPEAGPPQE